MDTYNKALEILGEIFGEDRFLTLATARDNTPSIRMVDAFYHEGAFYVVTYATSGKVKEIEANPNAALCSKHCKFTCKGTNLGHPLSPENAAIRAIFLKKFEPWYFAVNNEDDPNTCYLKLEVTGGFVHKDGTGYVIHPAERKAETFEFVDHIPDIPLTDNGQLKMDNGQ